jgi:membrane protein required for colicin V production
MIVLSMLDYMLIALVLISTGISLFRGFFSEAVSFATWLIALWVAWKFGTNLAGGLVGWVTDPVLRIWLARGLVFIGVLLIGGLIERLLDHVMKSLGLNRTNRAIGMVFGMARGVVLAGLLVMLLEVMGFSGSAWWQSSKLLPYLAPVTDIIRSAAEDGFGLLDGAVK